ncbi:dihydrolipoyl dehydrogenase [Verrucomicrobiota bacterium]
MEKFDVTVIGAGPGGYPAAIRAAQLGASVAIVEKEKLGGTCLNWGCIPTKTLIASSGLFDRMKNAEELGLSAANASFDYLTIAKRKNDVVAKLGQGVEMLLKSNGVTIFNGTASFLSRNKISVKNGKSETTIETGSTIIATGSESAMPGFIPKHTRVLESRQFLDLRALPENIIVLGGGVIGCEFACMAAQLGSKVTIAELLDDILIMLDSDIRREARHHMEEKIGIEILTGSAMENIKADKNGVSGKVGEKEIKGDILLVSVGRRPVTEDLHLEKADLAVNEAGFIEVDEYCRTSTATIYAIGDVTAGSTQLAHAATSQGITAAENASTKTRNSMEAIVPACIFTAPEIGSVGLSEQDAKEQELSVKIGKYAFSGLGKAMAAGETNGFVKWVVDAETDQLLGAHAVGPHATELVSEAVVAIRNELTATELGTTIHCHPTFSEAWMEAAHAVHGKCIHQPAKRKK